MCSLSKRTVGTLVSSKNHHIRMSGLFDFIFLLHTHPCPPLNSPMPLPPEYRPPPLCGHSPTHTNTSSNTPLPPPAPRHGTEHTSTSLTPPPSQKVVLQYSRGEARKKKQSPSLTPPLFFHTPHKLTLTTPHHTCVATNALPPSTPLPPPPAFRLQTEGVASGFYLTTATTQQKNTQKNTQIKHYPSLNHGTRRKGRGGHGGLKKRCAE